MDNSTKSPHAMVQGLPQHSVHWKGGFWQNRFQQIVEVMVPNMHRLFAADDIAHVVANFAIAAGEREGAHEGPPFSDGDFFKWLEAASYAYGTQPDAKLKGLIDDAVAMIGRAQRKDGYLFTKQIIEDRSRPEGGDGALSNSLNFEVYNMGHLMTAACVHFRATKETTLLDIARKAADYLVRVFEASRSGKAKTAICPSHYMGLIELYRTTGDGRYLDAAELAIALRDKVENGTDDNQDRKPLREHREAVGHAVRSNYLYAGVADLYAEQGDESLKTVIDSVWNDITTTKLAINCGCGAHYDGVSPYGSWDHPNIQRTHQAYGRAYELPNITAYNETCASVGNILWNWRMFLLEPKPSYIDVIERTLYNLILASTSIDGKKFFYQNTLRRELELPFDLKWSRKRESYISSFCCPPNMLRTLTESAMYTYAIGEDSLYTGIYGESSAVCTFPCGTSFRLEQRTDYPWDGRITLTTTEGHGKTPIAIHLRVPGWARSGTIHLPSGETINVTPEMAGTYIRQIRAWHESDMIVMDFPMEARLYTAHPLVEEDNNHVAVQRGPILYCIESCDFPDARVFQQAAILNPPRFSTETMVIEGLQVVALRADGLWLEDDFDSAKGQLYQGLTYHAPRPLRMRLVPYFAWDNRGFHAMKVWIPVQFRQ